MPTGLATQGRLKICICKTSASADTYCEAGVDCCLVSSKACGVASITVLMTLASHGSEFYTATIAWPQAISDQVHGKPV